MTLEAGVRKPQSVGCLAHRFGAIRAARRLDAELFDARRPLLKSLAAPQDTYLNRQDDVTFLGEPSKDFGDLFHRILTGKAGRDGPFAVRSIRHAASRLARVQSRQRALHALHSDGLAVCGVAG